MSSRLSLTLVALALVLVGCDRQAPEEAQGEGELAGEKASLSATFDRSRAGALMPAITVADPDGTELNLAAAQGTPVLLNLWATWCAPCRAEMPALDKLQQQAGGDDFEVVAINVDTGSDDKPKDFLAEIGVKDLAFYREDTLKLFTDVKKRGLALGLPVTFLVDEEGCLLTHMNGPAEWAGADAAGWIAAARRAAD